ncbi:MAG: hypothetical protein HYR76_03565 [Ignavibacteria bacterium]|nr:hypothetical protein [Ignavibacteria bacterium]
MTVRDTDIAAQTILIVVSYITASAILIVGIIVLTGFIIPSYVPENYRIIMGVAMVLYGVYRLTMLRIKQRKMKRDDV